MDEIIIGIGVNDNKKTWFPTEKRVEMIKRLYANESRIRVEAYDNLTVDFAQQRNAKFIIRGIRTVRDFEYEETIADINRKLAGIETILLFTEPELTAISSTIVRELLQYGKDVTPFLQKDWILIYDENYETATLLLCNFFFFCSVVAQNKMLNSPSRKLQLAEFAISNLYVDQVDENKLVESAIVKMLEQLDPHSTYSDPEEVKALNSV